jgi:RNA polymerase sigma-70 factor, ECF subfamily
VANFDPTPPGHETQHENLPYMHRCCKAVRSIIYRITKNREDTEDALQDTALKAFTHLKGFEGRSTFASWMLSIASNSALMLLRRRRRRPVTSIEEVSGVIGNYRAWEPQDYAESPEAYYVRRRSEELLRKSIQRLPRIYREAVKLQHAEECSVGRVAERLGISEAAAKARLRRGRGMLQQRLSSGGLDSAVEPRGASSSRTNSEAASTMLAPSDLR